MIGNAMYKPIKRDTHYGLVGNVAFFNDDGDYKWLRNAFYPGVYTNTPIVFCTDKYRSLRDSSGRDWQRLSKNWFRRNKFRALK